MNILAIPFHDYRKILINGYRNRDTHFILEFINSKTIENVIIVNRPISGIEKLVRRLPEIKGEIVYEKDNYKLIKIKSGLYIIDSIFKYDIKLLFKQKLWFWESYGKPKLLSFINDSLLSIGINDYCVYNSTLYSRDLINRIESKKIVFDAFDNWMKFPVFSKWIEQISSSYSDLSKVVGTWVTNSDENRSYFTNKFNTKNCLVLKNGVDLSLFNDPYNKEFIPYQNIPRPILGFGGSITHLLDIDLLNYVVQKNPNYSFVIVGPIMNKSIYNKIIKNNNLYFLGNIHYMEYPNYVKNFDVGIIPYNSSKNSHGGDSIKFYEYLAAKKPIVSTYGNGVYQVNDNVFISNDKTTFNDNLKRAITTGWQECVLPEEISWSFKANKIIEIFNSDI